VTFVKDKTKRTHKKTDGLFQQQCKKNDLVYLASSTTSIERGAHRQREKKKGFFQGFLGRSFGQRKRD